MITIRDLVDLVNTGGDFFFFCPAFLDEFYQGTDELRQQMIQEEPDFHEDLDWLFYCDVAAIAHKLANDFKLNVPEWVHHKKYILSEPYYELNTKSDVLRSYFESVSPYEFKIRNIFVDANTLDRI